MIPVFPAKKLMDWFLEHQRKLPWRVHRTPYRVWISEIMLQQTQVDTVIPYYLRWMKTYPSLRKLSRANESDLIYHWQGLGYYNRVKNILKTAKILDEKKKFPKKVAELIQLPGIGKYTAGAISSFAFNEPSAIVDGNIKRFLMRFYDLNFSEKNDRFFWDVSENLISDYREVIDKYSFQIFNESLIEIGALVCMIRPKCNICPVRRECGSWKTQTTYKLPYKFKKTIEKQQSSIFLIKKKDRFLLFKRNNTELLKGLNGTWEFPVVEHHKEIVSHEGKNLLNKKQIQILLKKLNEKYGVNLSPEMNVSMIQKQDNLSKPFIFFRKCFKHRYTNYQTFFYIYQIDDMYEKFRWSQFREKYLWVNSLDLGKFGLSKINQKVRSLIT